MTNLERLRCWFDSVQGLRAHVHVYCAMRKAAACYPQTEVFKRQLRDQEAMIGHAFLHVVLVHPIGSGRFY